MMTDRSHATVRPSSFAIRAELAAAGETDARARASAQARRAHPLLGAFPLAAMVLGTFLVLFALMMGRFRASVDPALRASASSALVAGSSGASAVRTRTSGGRTPRVGEPPAVASPRSSRIVPAVVTRTSGASGATEARDD
jgi:hypothetical protein